MLNPSSPVLRPGVLTDGQLRAEAIHRGKHPRTTVGKVRKLRSENRQEELITSLIGLTAIFVATAIWWSVAPQWLTSSWQTFQALGY